MWWYICDHNSGKSWWILIIFTYLEMGMNALHSPQVRYLLICFRCDVNMTSLSHSWHCLPATASAACVARLGAVADWWHSCICASGGHFEDTLWLSICFLCTWWTLLFHTMLDAVGNVLRVHYKSLKCDVSFAHGSVSTLFRRDKHVFHVCV